MVALAAPSVEPLYREAYPEAVARGIPLHVTLLFPFVPAERLDEALPRLQAVLERHGAFDFELTRVETFDDGVVWLAPEPAAPFRALTHAIHEAFPEHPPYGGMHDEVIPHATLTHVEAADLASALAAYGPRADALLPLAQRADDVAVLREDEPDRWVEAVRLPLGAHA